MRCMQSLSDSCLSCFDNICLWINLNDFEINKISKAWRDVSSLVSLLRNEERSQFHDPVDLWWRLYSWSQVHPVGIVSHTFLSTSALPQTRLNTLSLKLSVFTWPLTLRGSRSSASSQMFCCADVDPCRLRRRWWSHWGGEWTGDFYCFHILFKSLSRQIDLILFISYIL